MRFLIILFSFAVLLGSAHAARAQDSSDAAALNNRLDRMERDLNALERQVYRGGGSPPAATTNGGAPEGSGPAVLQTEDRLARLDDQMRDLNGKVEVINNAISQMNERLDKLSNDVDMRLSALERGGAAPVANGASGSPAPGAVPSRAAAGTLGTLPAAPSGAAPAATAASPREQYQDAFALLRRADYPGAEQALRTFIAQHPNDPLAGNAQYWLGETYYVRRNWKDAAIAFAEGYQKYPKSSKAPDELLKLAMSLGNMGQKANACTALGRLRRDFPQMPANVRGPATAEKQRLGC
ncbi:MAG: tol-pal system protein YbgF [Alphaproteobacteria bacterium]|nr:tol-pal system protein YbgF [Alphaproteobacteria bacterium]